MSALVTTDVIERSAGNLIERLLASYGNHRKDIRSAQNDGCCAFPFEDCPYCGGREFKQQLALLMSQSTAEALVIAQAALGRIAPMACFLVFTGEKRDEDDECGRCFSCSARKAQREIAEVILK